MNMPFPVSDNELQRLKAIDSYSILDSLPEQEYDDIARIAAHICDCPISTVALVDIDRKWHKAKFGIDKDSVPREAAICSYTILSNKPLIITNTLQHPIFHNLDMVKKPPYVQFYAGIPLLNSDGFALGTLCVVDTQPKEINEFQIQSLEALARHVIALMELRKSILALTKTQKKLLNKQETIDKLNTKLTQLSFTDELTKLKNRRALSQEYNAMIERQQGNVPLSLMMLDLDKFKLLNDKNGHTFGDNAIKAVAAVLLKYSRKTDFCFRFGGDEFIILMPNTSEQQSLDVASRINTILAEGEFFSEPLFISIGIAVITRLDINECEAIKIADNCLYLAKDHDTKKIISATI